MGRLPIKNIQRGSFDAKLIDQKGRICIGNRIDLGRDTTFDIRDTGLTNCQ